VRAKAKEGGEGEGEGPCNESSLPLQFGGGDGSEQRPYLACTRAHLELYGAVGDGIFVEVTKSIPMTTTPWVPLNCRGVLRGPSPVSDIGPTVSITGMQVAATGDAGFCATLTGKILGLEFAGANVTGSHNVAVVAAQVTDNGSIEDVVVRNATVEATTSGNAAGIAGRASGSVTINRVALVDGTISNLRSKDGIVAGVVSDLGAGCTVAHAVVLGVRMTGRSVVGGLTGKLSGALRSSAIQDVALVGVGPVGGAVGSLEGTIEDVAVHDVSLSSSSTANARGGLVGESLRSNALIERCTVGHVDGAFHFDVGAGTAILSALTHRRASITDSTGLPGSAYVHPDGFEDFDPHLWQFSAGVNPAPIGLLRPRCGNGIVDVGEACDRNGVGVNLSGSPGCTVTCAVADNFVCGGMLSMCVRDSAAKVAGSVEELFSESNSSGLVYANMSGNKNCPISNFPVGLGGTLPLVLVGPGPDLSLSCTKGFRVEQGGVALTGLAIFGRDGDVIATEADSDARLVLAGVTIVGSGAPGAGVSVAAGTTGQIVAVTSKGVQTPFLFNGSGLLVNSVSVPSDGGASRLTPSPGALEARFNNFAEGSTVCNTNTTFTDSLVHTPAPLGSCGDAGTVHTVELDFDGRETSSSGHTCSVPRDGLAFDVDLQRRTGATFNCGADEVSGAATPPPATP
jgi:hypothetical protein